MARSKQSKRIQELLLLREWDTFEVKRVEAQPRHLLETICAFANHEGGVLAVGIEDPKKAEGEERLLGISTKPDNLSELLKFIRSEFDPPLQHFITTQTEDIINTRGVTDMVCLMRVEKSDDIHSLKNGDTFVRKGSQNIKIGAQEILRLRYERGSIKFETEKSELASLDNIDDDLLDRYQADTGSKGQDKWQFMKDNGLATNKNRLTKGGVLLFGKNPAVALSSKCSIKISHYFGTEQTYSGEPNFVRRPFTIEGPLLHQIKKTVEYFQQVVKQSPPKLHNGTFRPGLLVPEWVFQEAIANAIIHRNYTIQDDIHVRFFDDRIEIESPGSYPAHVTPSNIRTERFARNPSIQRVLSRFQEAPNLDIGEGVDRMFAIMRENNLYEPIFFPVKIRPNSVLVALVNEQRVDYWDTVASYLDKNNRITNREIREITGINDTLQVSRLLSEWTKQGLLEKRGGKTRGAYYVKTGQDIFGLLFNDLEK